MVPPGGCALVVCDAQPDALAALAPDARETLVARLHVLLDGARRAGWPVVFTGLRFPAGYAGLAPTHKVYGALARLNAKVGDSRAHWFMDGHAGCDIEQSLLRPSDVVSWRASLDMPELLVQLTGVQRAVVCGIKAVLAVQTACRILCDAGISVEVVRGCVEDDVASRLTALLDHVLPTFADVVAYDEVAARLGFEEDEVAPPFEPGIAYVTDCGRAGSHGHLYCAALLERPGWQEYPARGWYTDMFTAPPREYYCPRGKQVVDFADEPQFSKVSMYIKGREWLEDKSKVVAFATGFMPPTYLIEDGRWRGAAPSEEEGIGPWFVKRATGNWGGSVRCAATVSECLVLALEEPEALYVVQPHVPDPLLTSDGCKQHVKFYNLLVEAGGTWRIYTYRDGYLCYSPMKWSAEDTSTETQVTIVRNKRLSDAQWSAWPEAYPKFQGAVVEMVGNAVRAGKLQERNKHQFEIFSADFMLDASGRAWFLEFNMDCVLRDQSYSETVNDLPMIHGALSIVLPWEGADPALWDFAGEFTSQG